MSNKLKIFTKNYPIVNVIEEQLLYFGKLTDDVINKNNTFRDLKVEDINKVIEYTDIESCDFIYHPFKINKNDNIDDLITLSEEYGKKIILFYNDDDDSVFNFKNSIIFRTSIHNSTKPKNYFSVPAFCNDLKKESNYFFRVKNEKPTIGFCGAITHNLRKMTIDSLNKSDIPKNFIIRNNFWGGHVWGDTVRNEYIKNSMESDFIICVRGAGNFSYRLYETICLGRIPLIIDSDISLPFDNLENHRKKFLIINDLNNIESEILNYWSKINNYEELQKNLITLWEENFSPLGFIKKLNKHKNEISNFLH
jgi:hypothetical protein